MFQNSMRRRIVTPTTISMTAIIGRICQSWLIWWRYDPAWSDRIPSKMRHALQSRKSVLPHSVRLYELSTPWDLRWLGFVGLLGEDERNLGARSLTKYILEPWDSVRSAAQMCFESHKVAGWAIPRLLGSKGPFFWFGSAPRRVLKVSCWNGNETVDAVHMIRKVPWLVEYSKFWI